MLGNAGQANRRKWRYSVEEMGTDGDEMSNAHSMLGNQKVWTLSTTHSFHELYKVEV